MSASIPKNAPNYNGQNAARPEKPRTVCDVWGNLESCARQARRL